MPTLQDKTTMVTGASQDSGEQVTKVYVNAGTAVILVARHQKKLEKVYDAITASGGPESFAICFDLVNAEENEFAQFAAVVDEAADGRPDGIVYYANYFYSLPPLDFQTVAEWVNQCHINTVASVDLIRAFAPMLRTSLDTSIILVNESHSETPQACWGGFGASKAALNYLCKVAIDEWEHFPNLCANVLIPGPANSPQRIKSHPGGSRIERKDYHDILPQFVWWANEESKGHAGEIAYLQPACRSHPHRQRNQI